MGYTRLRFENFARSDEGARAIPISTNNPFGALEALFTSPRSEGISPTETIRIAEAN